MVASRHAIESVGSAAETTSTQTQYGTWTAEMQEATILPQQELQRTVADYLSRQTRLEHNMPNHGEAKYVWPATMIGRWINTEDQAHMDSLLVDLVERAQGQHRRSDCDELRRSTEKTSDDWTYDTSSEQFSSLVKISAGISLSDCSVKLVSRHRVGPFQPFRGASVHLAVFGGPLD